MFLSQFDFAVALFVLMPAFAGTDVGAHIDFACGHFSGCCASGKQHQLGSKAGSCPENALMSV